MASQDGQREWRMPRIDPPSTPHTLFVPRELVVAIASTSLPALLAIAVRPLLPTLKCDIALAAGAAMCYLGGYCEMLGLGVKDAWSSKRAHRAWCFIAAGKLAAVLPTSSSRSLRRSATSLALCTCTLWSVFYAVTFGTSHLREDPRPLPTVMKTANHWSRYFHTRARDLAVGLAALAYGWWKASPAAVAFTGAAWISEARLWLKSRRWRSVELTAHEGEMVREQAKLLGVSLEEYSSAYLGMLTESPLVVGGDGRLFWRECHSASVPCFTHFYVSVLGTNTPPCCAKHMVALASAASQIFSDLGILHWIDGGTLLGAVRHHGEVLPWEDDIDLAYLAPDNKAILPGSDLAAVLTAEFAKHGFTFTVSEYGNMHILHATTPTWPFTYEILRMEPYRSIHLDIVPFRVKTVNGKEVVWRYTLARQTGGYKEVPKEWPSAAVLPLRDMTLGGRTFPAPADPDAYLTNLYGNWHEVSYQYITHVPVRRVRMKVDQRYVASHIEGFKAEGWGGVDRDDDR